MSFEGKMLGSTYKSDDLIKMKESLIRKILIHKN